MIKEITTTVTRTVELVPAVAGEQQEKHVLTVRDYSSFGRSRCPQIKYDWEVARKGWVCGRG